MKNKELEQFTYIASHDLQEPLNTISSMVRLLANEYKGKLDQEGDKVLQFMSQAVTRMNALIKGLLDYSRIGMAKELNSVDCTTLIKNVQADLGASFSETNTSIGMGKLPTIKAYETELRLLFQNLIANAIKFRQKKIKPQIKISARRKSNHWEFSVRDNGIGIAEKHREKIFVIFQRLHRRNEYKGTGIGLSHCQKIVELHGGKIWVESKPDNGSTFYFTIPDQQ